MHVRTGEAAAAAADVNGGILPGGLGVRRRAPDLHRQLTEIRSDDGEGTHADALSAMEWVNLWALAVNEENAAGGRVVTAPTNGAAGIIPAVMHYALDHVVGFTPQAARRFLLAAGAIGIVVKENASISGAEVGCQGEVGSAAAMAAAVSSIRVRGPKLRRTATQPIRPEAVSTPMPMSAASVMTRSSVSFIARSDTATS